MEVKSTNKRIEKKKRKNNAILYSAPFGFYGLGPIDIQKANAIARKRQKWVAEIKRKLERKVGKL